jgi:predicted nucleotidyltransferase
MQNPEIENIKQKIIPILKQHDVTKASIFGSFVHGKQRNDSDLDLLVEFNGDKSLFDLIDLKLNIEDTIGRSADVLTFESLNPAIREIVLKEQVIVF